MAAGLPQCCQELVVDSGTRQEVTLEPSVRPSCRRSASPGTEQLQLACRTVLVCSLARVVCDCMDDVDQLQPFAFLQPDQFANIRTSCRGGVSCT